MLAGLVTHLVLSGALLLATLPSDTCDGECAREKARLGSELVGVFWMAATVAILIGAFACGWATRPLRGAGLMLAASALLWVVLLAFVGGA